MRATVASNVCYFYLRHRWHACCLSPASLACILRLSRSRKLALSAAFQSSSSAVDLSPGHIRDISCVPTSKTVVDAGISPHLHGNPGLADCQSRVRNQFEVDLSTKLQELIYNDLCMQKANHTLIQNWHEGTSASARHP
jgi:hypothetical protein